MIKTLDTEKYTIGNLLGRYERRYVKLPPFQRSFSWEKTQINQFWDDLVLFQKDYVRIPTTASYFLGPIVIIQEEDHILLLDGQQRLATSTITLSAMRDVARTLDKSGMTKGADLARDIQRELIEKDTEPATFSLILGDLDEPFFIKAIKTDPPAVPRSKLRSHNLISTAYNIAKERISTIIVGMSYDESLKMIKSFCDALSKGMSLIGMVVQSEEDAYTIFETLNDRGLRLSVPDLALNLLMKRAPDDTARNIVRQYWNTMLRQMGKRDVSRFLRHMWVSRYGDLKSEGLYTAIKKNLDASKLASIEFAELCADECDSYVALLDANIPIPSVLSNLEGIVKYLRINSAPPLLLSGYRCLEQTEFEKLVKLILIIHIRFVLITNQNPLDLESKFYEAAREIRTSKEKGETSGKTYQIAKKFLSQLFVDDSKIKENINDLTLERSEAIWLMTQIANCLQSKTKEIGMDKANLEHIFPQNPGAAWPNKTQLEPYTWNIGNLTILGERINKDAKNRGFTDKCTNYYKKSEILMTQDILSYKQWDETSIQTRAKSLAENIIKLWPQN